MRILGLIPARGGSKGIPRKNLAPFRGRPLLQWTCEAALRSRELSSVVLTTEDAEIAERGRAFGVRVPFLRPRELALDATPSLPVVQHALRALAETGEEYDAVCLLQPTNPLRTAEDIDAACRRLGESGADSVVSVGRVPSHFHPMWTYLLDERGDLRQALPGAVVPRRQDLPPAFWREGSLYVTLARILLAGNSLYGSRVAPYFMPEERSGGIDTPEDLAELERRAPTCAG